MWTPATHSRMAECRTYRSHCAPETHSVDSASHSVECRTHLRHCAQQLIDVSIHPESLQPQSSPSLHDTVLSPSPPLLSLSLSPPLSLFFIFFPSLYLSSSSLSLSLSLSLPPASAQLKEKDLSEHPPHIQGAWSSRRGAVRDSGVLCKRYVASSTLLQESEWVDLTGFEYEFNPSMKPWHHIYRLSTLDGCPSLDPLHPHLSDRVRKEEL
jgi:hypothetical protein